MGLGAERPSTPVTLKGTAKPGFPKTVIPRARLHVRAVPPRAPAPAAEVPSADCCWSDEGMRGVSAWAYISSGVSEVHFSYVCSPVNLLILCAFSVGSHVSFLLT